MKSLVIFIPIFLSFASPRSALSASFDCAKAATSPEKMICADSDLSAADTALTNTYQKALSVAPNKVEIKEAQRDWMKTRDACKDSACMKKAYQERMKELEKVAALPLPKQETLQIQNASKQYDLTIKIAGCGQDRYLPEKCSGPAKISLFKKGATTPFQVIDMENAEIDRDTATYNPKINKNARELYGEEFGVVFDDFNFDGQEDLAICNGRTGGYGSASYNVYLFQKNSNQFVENKKLTKLASENLGLFLVDSKKRLLLSFSKSGCCYHVTEKYQMANNNPVLVEKIIEDATGDGETALITRKKLVNGKWVKSVKREKLTE